MPVNLKKKSNSNIKIIFQRRKWSPTRSSFSFHVSAADISGSKINVFNDSGFHITIANEFN